MGELDGLGLPIADIVDRGWDVPALEERYGHLLERFEALTPDGGGAEFLTALMQLDAELQQLLVTDPALPPSMTPNCSYRAAAQRLLALRRHWHGPTKRHWTSVVESVS